MLTLFASLALVVANVAWAQPTGYRGLEELGDPSNEARQILVFEAKAGNSLRFTLDSWSKRAGWSKPRWDVPGDTDFALGGTVRFEGDYRTATQSFVKALGAEANLQVRFDLPQRRAVISLRSKVPATAH
jgi:hypothetical protein